MLEERKQLKAEDRLLCLHTVQVCRYLVYEAVISLDTHNRIGP